MTQPGSLVKSASESTIIAQSMRHLSHTVLRKNSVIAIEYNQTELSDEPKAI